MASDDVADVAELSAAEKIGVVEEFLMYGDACLILVGPAGSGKRSAVRAALAALPNSGLEVSVYVWHAGELPTLAYRHADPDAATKWIVCRQAHDGIAEGLLDELAFSCVVSFAQ